MNKEQVLGFNVSLEKKDELLNNIFKDYINKEQLFIVNINPEIIVKNYKNIKIKEKFNNEKYQIPDGIGIIWALKKKKRIIRERITGIDLMQDILKNAEKYEPKVYLYGAKQEVIERAKQELKKQYSSIQIVGTMNGFCNENKVVEDIIQKQPDIVFVGTGSPKQEQFILNHKEELKSVKIFMPVGGSFDVISKAKKRAPNWIIKLKLEWLYRLFQEPQRIFRQLKLIKFMILVLGEKNEKN